MELFKVVDTRSAFFAIAPRPSAENLPSEFCELRDKGVSTIISLIEVHESLELGLQHEERASTCFGIKFLQHPMPDRKPPHDFGSFTATVKRILQNLERGESTVAHCVGGIGRSGLIASAVLLNLDRSPSEALAAVSTARGRAAPDTPAQIEWFKINAKRLRLNT